MALPILDGNQSATTLSTILTGGAHIPAHTVVSLGSQAISDITSAVSGISVSIGGTQTTTFGAVTGSVSVLNFPSTQTIAGTVTANAFGANQAGSLLRIPVAEAGDAQAETGVPIAANIGGGPQVVGDSYPLPISGTVTANLSQNFVADDAGTVPNYAAAIGFGNESGDFNLVRHNAPLPVSGTVTANLASNYYDASNDWNLQRTAIHSETGAGEFSPIGFNNSLPISGTVTANVVGIIEDESMSEVLNKGIGLAYTATITDNALPHVVSESKPLPVRLWASTVTIGNSVTIGSLPSGSLTTRFGSVVTANLSFITSAVTNTSRKYLLAQNISAGTVTIGIGFSPTTTQGIQLAAGGGLTFDAFCPTGAVYWLGAVTGANYCLIEG